MKVSGKDLKIAVKRSDYTQNEAAYKLGISRMTFINWFALEELPHEILQNIKVVLGIDLVNQPVKTLQIPVYQPITEPQTLESIEPAFYVHIPQFADCDFGRIYFGNDMKPTIENGTFIFCKRIKDMSLLMYGEIHYIEVDNSYAIARRVKHGRKPGEFLAVADNADYETNHIKIASVKNIYLVKGILKQIQN